MTMTASSSASGSLTIPSHEQQGHAETKGTSRPQRRGATIRVQTLGNAALSFGVFLGGFVIHEPAPYELYMAGLVGLWFLCGLKLHRGFAPLILCMMLFIAGGTLSVPLATDMPTAIIYMCVSAFLAITSLFYAALIAEDPDRHRVIERAYIFSAVIVAIIGIMGYFHLVPNAELFLRAGRAKGTFQDPNVFGPFLLLPSLLLLRRILARTWKRPIACIVLLMILLLGLFLSFSRAAWGMLVLSSVVVYVLLLINHATPKERLRLVMLGAGGLMMAVVLLMGALSIDSVHSMFEQRAKITQNYDTARLGRFNRYAIGFGMVLERPLGLGPLEFEKYFPEDEHNTYLKGYTTYGWLGGTTYIVLVFWTLAALFRTLFRQNSWTPFAQCIFAALLVHFCFSAIIDIDHWRHFYMLYGLAWGLIAADKLDFKQRIVGQGKRALHSTNEAARKAPVGQ